jgi:serine/alanine adding enzyme
MIHVEYAKDSHETLWNEYVSMHDASSVYHCFSFRNIIKHSFRRDSYYLIATDSESGKPCGVLPLFLFTGPLAGRCLISLPFFDGGGMCVDNKEAAQKLLSETMVLMQSLRCTSCELRQEGRIPFESELAEAAGAPRIMSTKVRMLLDLPQSPDALFKSFPAKLRSQIRRPKKENCMVHEGAHELVDDFYGVLCRNMRDLGSPVEPKQTFHNAIDGYPGLSRIFVVYWKNIPIACSFIFGFKNRIINRWASTNRDYKQFAPNMLLYWRMLEYAIEKGYSAFDFGRSTIGETTYNFKAQWGAQPRELFWYRYCKKGKHGDCSKDGTDMKKHLFANVWTKLPVPLATALGSSLRRHVTL